MGFVPPKKISLGGPGNNISQDDRKHKTQPVYQSAKLTSCCPCFVNLSRINEFKCFERVNGFEFARDM